MIPVLLLFGSAFLAATILPFYSEVLLFTLLRKGHDPHLLFWVATTGNTLGSVVTGGWGGTCFGSSTGPGFISVRPRSHGPRPGFSGTASGPCCWPGCRLEETR